MANKTVGYFSAYYRGLQCLAKMWPEILKAEPDAKLHVAYGWESWLALEGQNGLELYNEIEAFFKQYKSSVTHYGRLSHEDLAKLMKQTKVWAYPTEFAEIHCITALKAQAAGCIVVTTNVAALKETVINGTKIDVANLYSNDYAQSKFIKAVVKGLNTKDNKNELSEDWYWPAVAKQWSNLMEAK